MNSKEKNKLKKLVGKQISKIFPYQTLDGTYGISAITFNDGSAIYFTPLFTENGTEIFVDVSVDLSE